MQQGVDRDLHTSDIGTEKLPSDEIRGESVGERKREREGEIYRRD